MTARLLATPRSRLPEAARRYLDHAISDGTPPARAVRLRMHGEIRLPSGIGRREWTPFTAEETIRAGRDLRWKARASVFGLPIEGFDRVVRGYGESQWKLFGALPVASARGANVSRSGVARMAAESVWLPSVLADEGVRWSSDGPDRATFALTLFGHAVEVALTLSPAGGIETLSLLRWGAPDGLPYGLYPFGGYVEDEATFEGFTIPSRLRLGWHFGTDRFAREGERFRVAVESATYR